MKQRYIFLALLFSFSLSVVKGQIIYCSDSTAWNYDVNAEPEDSLYCLYFDECDDPNVQRYFEVYGGYVHYGTEFYFISTDLQDTLGSYVYSDWGWGGVDFDRNIWAVCVDPNACYFIDIRLPEPLSYWQLFMWAHSTYPRDYYQQFSVPNVDEPTDHYRMSFSAEAYNCGTVGCTDPLAENYNPFATYNFGCVYCQESAVKVSSDFIFSGVTPWQIIGDSGLVASGSFNHNDTLLTELVCLDTGCYNFRIHGDDYRFNEISLSTVDDSILTTMSLTQDSEAFFPFGIGVDDCSDPEEVYGCTNPLGQNYNPQATIDDGSCDLQNDECGIDLSAFLDTAQQQIVIDPDFFATDYPVHIFWDMGDGSDAIDGALGDVYLYDTVGTYEVCATLYSFIFFENLPLCYDTACIIIDATEYGFSGGFPLFLNDGTISVDEVNFAEELILYPNPATDFIRIEGVSANLESFAIHTLDGKQIQEEVGPQFIKGEFRFDTSDLPSGVYLISLVSEGTLYVGRLMISR